MTSGSIDSAVKASESQENCFEQTSIRFKTNQKHPLDKAKEVVKNLSLPPLYHYTVNKTEDRFSEEKNDETIGEYSLMSQFSSKWYLNAKEAIQLANLLNRWEKNPDGYVSSAEGDECVELNYDGGSYELTPFLTFCNLVIYPNRYSLPELDFIQKLVWDSGRDDGNYEKEITAIDTEGVWVDGKLAISHRCLIKQDEKILVI